MILVKLYIRIFSVYRKRIYFLLKVISGLLILWIQNERELNYMKTIVFGVGNYYREQKEKLDSLDDIEVIAFADNNASLWNKKVNGITVISPDLIQTFEYDKIMIMSIYVCAIYKQLLTLGVDEDRIIIWDRFYKSLLQGSMRMFGTARNDIAGKQKVLIISQELNYDGGTLASIYAAMALKDRGIPVILSVPNGNQKLINEVAKKGVEIVLCPSLPYIFDADKKWFQQFDIVIVNLFTMIESAYEINKFCPVLWWLHEASQTYKTAMAKYIACLHMRTITEMSIYAVSDIAKRNFNNEMKDIVKKKLTIGIPDMANLISRKKREDGKMIFAIIGTIHSLKAQDIFVRAASMADGGDKSEFWMIGRSIDKEYFEKVCKIAAGVNSVRILGELSREEINKTFSDIDVLVCASHEETLSMTVIEAMMHGKACITTANTGIAEYIENGVNGFVISNNNVDALAEKMQWLAEHREKAEEMGVAARKTYERYFTMDVFAQNLENALRETVQKWKQGETNESPMHLCDL